MRVLVLALFLSGCSAAPAIVPTGNPLSDVVVNTVVAELTRQVVLNADLPEWASQTEQCERGRSGMLYCGDW